MLSTTHAASGAVIGSACTRLSDAVMWGWGSHFILDALPHWGSSDRRRFLRVARADGLTMLAVSAALVAAAPPPRRLRVAVAIAAAVAPDLDKPVRHFFGCELYPPALQHFHARIQRGRESDRRLAGDTARAAAATVCALMVVRRAR
jgi:hypothetical protein